MKRFAATTAPAWLLVAACHSFRSPDPAPPTPSPPIRELVSYLQQPQPSCFRMVERFCDTLYHPEVRGNLDLVLGDAGIQVRRGKTENAFSQAYYTYARTQFRNRGRLPGDFLVSLESGGYFRKLSGLLNRPPRKASDKAEILRNVRIRRELDAVWKAAIDQTVLIRMERNYPGFVRMDRDRMPVELSFESRRTRATLISQIAKAFWEEHPNWKRVQRQTEEVRKQFVEMIQASRLPARIQRDWIRRIRSVRLVVPGADPQIENFQCSQTEENAYYYPYENQMTVCAGHFNADDNVFTLAHEMAHALGHHRTILLFERRSALGEKLASLRTKSCSRAPEYPCQDWREFKEKFEELALFTENFQPQLPKFRSCLVGGGSVELTDAEGLRGEAERISRRQLTNLAKKGLFLRLISEKIPLPSGQVHANPMYYNPCGYYLWERRFHPFEEELAFLLFFNAEYRCHDDADPRRRFQAAVDTARMLHTDLVAARMRMEGGDSRREFRLKEGAAVSSEERFADSLATEVFARLLRKQASVFQRRAMFLSNLAGFCPEPSLRQMYPDMARLQYEMASIPHSAPVQRLREILTPSIRETLQCDLDFKVLQCSIQEENPALPGSAVPASGTSAVAPPSERIAADPAG